MSKNMNKRFFAEFLALLSLKVTYYAKDEYNDDDDDDDDVT